jgi:hypothetical protein
MRYSSWIKEKLLSLIKELDQYHWLFTRNAEKDFSRVKKWSFGEVVRFIISMEGKSLKDELLKRFNFSMETPTNSSFNQRRAQILPEAFEFLFREFNQVTYQEKLHRGYRMLACDGSDLSIAYDPLDETTYFQSTPDSKGFMVLLFKLCGKFCDLFCQRSDLRILCCQEFILNAELISQSGYGYS